MPARRHITIIAGLAAAVGILRSPVGGADDLTPRSIENGGLAFRLAAVIGEVTRQTTYERDGTRVLSLRRKLVLDGAIERTTLVQPFRVVGTPVITRLVDARGVDMTPQKPVVRRDPVMWHRAPQAGRRADAVHATVEYQDAPDLPSHIGQLEGYVDLEIAAEIEEVVFPVDELDRVRTIRPGFTAELRALEEVSRSGVRKVHVSLVMQRSAKYLRQDSPADVMSVSVLFAGDERRGPFLSNEVVTDQGGTRLLEHEFHPPAGAALAGVMVEVVMHRRRSRLEFDYSDIEFAASQ